MEINKLYLGESLEIMKDIEDKSIDMILCDLPYGITNCSWDFIIDVDKLWLEYKRISKKNTPIVLTANNPFASLLITSNIKNFRYDWVWNKVGPANFLNGKNMPLRIHEYILVFCYGGRANYYPQKTIGKLRDKSSRSTSAPTQFKEDGMYGKVNLESKKIINDGYYPQSIIKFSNRKQRDKIIHPTQKPVKLFEYLIKSYSKEGDVILDNCIGSGTTAIACLNTDRNYIGIEQDEKYFNLANERIKNHKVDKYETMSDLF